MMPELLIQQVPFQKNDRIIFFSFDMTILIHPQRNLLGNIRNIT